MSIGIIGTGLIGGSIGLRSRANGEFVLGFDTDAQNAAQALACGALDAVGTLDEIESQCETIAIAAHVRGTIGQLQRLQGRPVNAQLVIDVSSVKVPIVHAARGVHNFIATHPMAGSERSGPIAASAMLFHDCPWYFVPSGDEILDQRARRFIAAHGAHPIPVDAAEHDCSVAYTSHLPQVVATIFSRNMRGLGDDTKNLGPVARELIRLADSSEAMWRDIVDANGTNIAPHLRALARELLKAANHISSW